MIAITNTAIIHAFIESILVASLHPISDFKRVNIKMMVQYYPYSKREP